MLFLLIPSISLKSFRVNVSPQSPPIVALEKLSRTMLVLFLHLGTARCHTEIILSPEPHTYFVSAGPGDPICFNSTDIGTHVIQGEYNRARFTFFNTTDTSEIAARSTYSWLSVSISAPEPENLTFTSATFPNSCTLGFYYSNLPNSLLFLPNGSTDAFQAYDDRCFLVHAYNDSNVTVSWDTEYGHDFVFLNQDLTAVHSGIGSETFSVLPVSLWFTSDYAGVSNFVRLESSSAIVNGRGRSGRFPNYWPLVPSRTQPKRNGEDDLLSMGAIIGLCLGVVVVLGTVTSIVLYCLCRPVRRDIGHFDPEMVDSRPEVRVQALVDTDEHSQSGEEAFVKAAEVVLPII
jgi:hypothetical protein